MSDRSEGYDETMMNYEYMTDDFWYVYPTLQWGLPVATSDGTLSQEDFVQWWSDVVSHVELQDMDIDPRREPTCADCGNVMPLLPDIDAECGVCGIGKRQAQRYWRAEWMTGRDVFTRMVKSFRVCPDGHWLCLKCWGEIRFEEGNTEQLDL